MKKTHKRVLAFLLASTFVFSAMTAGVFAIASYLNPNLGSSATSSFMSVNSVDDFIDLVSGSPEVLADVEQPQQYNAQKEIVPTIIIPGISQSVSYLADENGNPAVNSNGEELSGGLLIIDSSTLPGTLAGTLAGPLVSSLLAQADIELYKDKRSKKYFASVLGITRQHYANIEEGTSNPSFELMQRFGKEFENQYEDLWELFDNGE